MTTTEIEAAVLRILGQVAPEMDPGQIKPEIKLRDQLDIDSMDFLNFMIGLHKEFGVAIAEKDYPKFATLRGCVDQLAAGAGTPR